MKGRIYAPTLGRFMQADPHIQAPKNSQNFNRYSYVLNNPMSYTDPSGYFFDKLFKGINKLLGDFAPFVAIAIGVFAGPWAAQGFWNAALVGFASGGVATGSLKGALIGAFSAGVFQQIGAHYKGLGAANVKNGVEGLTKFGGNMLTSTQIAGQIASHAVAGGVISTLSGGKFGHGFFSAGFTKGVGGGFLPAGSDLTSGEVFGGAILSAVLGGTASAISGGKFANGAQTGAFQFLFNQVASSAEKLAERASQISRLNASIEAVESDPDALYNELAKYSADVVFEVLQERQSPALIKSLSVLGIGIDLLNANAGESLGRIILRKELKDLYLRTASTPEEIEIYRRLHNSIGSNPIVAHRAIIERKIQNNAHRASE